METQNFSSKTIPTSILEVETKFSLSQTRFCISSLISPIVKTFPTSGNVNCCSKGVAFMTTCKTQLITKRDKLLNGENLSS